MRRRLWGPLVVLGVVGVLAGVVRPAVAAEWVVCPTCPVTSVKAAIAQAAPGDTVRVRAGVYREGNLLIDKPLTLAGEGEAVLDGEGRVEVVTVRADDVTVRDLVIANSGMSYTTDFAGIRAENVRNCAIVGNRLRDTFFGIYLAQVAACTVERNHILGHAVSETSSGNGIHLWSTDYVRVRDNHVEGHRDGIYLEFTRSTMVEGNVSQRNLRYGLHFMFSEGNEYTRNVFRESNAGVAVMYSKHMKMVENRFEDNWGPVAYGLLLKDVSDSEVFGNRFIRNTTGLFAEGANRLAVDGNRFERNGWAIRIMADSMGVVFAHNSFVGNAFEVATNGTRSWNALLENYWSEYRGYDLGRDGVGDVPHRPVRLFALLVERHPPALILLRSPFIELLDLAERVLPILTPRVLADHRPLMRSPS
jgi:nitrous oxidase accessory protein